MIIRPTSSNSGSSGVSVPEVVDLTGQSSPYTLTGAAATADSVVFTGTLAAQTIVIVPDEGSRTFYNTTDQTLKIRPDAALGTQCTIASFAADFVLVYDTVALGMSLSGTPFVTGGDLPIESNLVFNLNALILSGYSNLDPVPSWTDESGNDHHATNATVAQQFIYRANRIGTRPALVADGVDDNLSLGDLSAEFPTQASLYIVAKINSDTQYSLFETHSASDGYWRFAGDGNGYLHAFRSARLDTYPASTPNDGAHIWAIVSNSSGYQAYLDGVAQGSLQSAAYSAGDSYKIGAGGGGGAATADFGQIIGYADSHNATQVGIMTDALASLWGLTL